MPSSTGAANAMPASIPAHRVVGPFHFLPTFILAHYPLLLNQPGVAAKRRRIPAVLRAAPMSTQGKVRPTAAHPTKSRLDDPHAVPATCTRRNSVSQRQTDHRGSVSETRHRKTGIGIRTMMDSGCRLPVMKRFPGVPATSRRLRRDDARNAGESPTRCLLATLIAGSRYNDRAERYR